MDEVPTVHIARKGEVIVSCPASEIRQMVVNHQVLITDLYYDEESKTWKPLLPTPKRSTLLFDWAGQDDKLWFYIKDGFIHGPRQGDEIDALVEAEYIARSTLVCMLGMEEWITIENLLNTGTDRTEGGLEHFQAARNQLMQGNLWASAINFGVFVASAIAVPDANEDAKAPESVPNPSIETKDESDKTETNRSE